MSHYWEVTLGLSKTAPIRFFFNELLSSLLGPKSRYKVTFSSPMLCCPRGCIQVSSRLGEVLAACPSGDRLELRSERPWATRAGAWNASLGNSFRGEKEEVDDGGNNAKYSLWRQIKVLIGKCCILGTKPVSHKDFYFLIYEFCEAHLTDFLHCKERQ